MPEMVEITSSRATKIGYTDETKSLYVQFQPDKRGAAPTYRYWPTPREDYDGMVAGEISVGKYVATCVAAVREGVIQAERVAEAA